MRNTMAADQKDRRDTPRLNGYLPRLCRPGRPPTVEAASQPVRQRCSFDADR